MEECNDKLPKKGKITRAAILAMVLSGMMTLEAANIVLLSANPGDAPISEQEFLNAREAASQSSLSDGNEVLLACADPKGKASNKDKSKDVADKKEGSNTYTIISTDIKEDGSIVATLKNTATRKKIKMIDNEGDLVFDKLTSMRGKPLSITPEDIIITNLEETIYELRGDIPEPCIYAGPDFFYPMEPDAEN